MIAFLDDYKTNTAFSSSVLVTFIDAFSLVRLIAILSLGFDACRLAYKLSKFLKGVLTNSLRSSFA